MSLEVVAKAAGVTRLALEELIRLMCRAWSHDDSMARLHAAASIDAEFAEAVGQRIERRRFALQALVKRLGGERALSDAARRDLVDTLFAITSYPVFVGLGASGRSARQVAKLLARASLAIVDDALGAVDRGSGRRPWGAPGNGARGEQPVEGRAVDGRRRRGRRALGHGDSGNTESRQPRARLLTSFCQECSSGTQPLYLRSMSDTAFCTRRCTSESSVITCALPSLAPMTEDDCAPTSSLSSK